MVNIFDVLVMRSKYTTIPVTTEVKMLLEKLKGDRDWSDFLKSLVEDYLRLKKIIAAWELQSRFNEKIEKAILESTSSLRKLKMKGVFDEDSD